MKNFYRLLLLVLFSWLITPAAYAQNRIYVGKINDVVATYRKKAQAANNTIGLKAQVNHSVPGKQPLILKPKSRKQEGTTEFFYGEVYNTKYSNFYLKISDREASGSIVMIEQKKFYRYSSTADGSVYLTEEDIDKVLCVNYRKQEKTTSARSNQIVTVAATPPLLESLPGAGAVPYLDFDGETVTNTLWNSFNDGNPIVAAAYNRDEVEMVEIWKLISEDFRLFALNVTTSEAVFKSAPVNRRTRIIFTPTKDWYPNAGGVAFVGSFTWVPRNRELNTHAGYLTRGEKTREKQVRTKQDIQCFCHMMAERLLKRSTFMVKPIGLL